MLFFWFIPVFEYMGFFCVSMDQRSVAKFKTDNFSLMFYKREVFNFLFKEES